MASQEFNLIFMFRKLDRSHFGKCDIPYCIYYTPVLQDIIFIILFILLRQQSMLQKPHSVILSILQLCSQLLCRMETAMIQF